MTQPPTQPPPPPEPSEALTDVLARWWGAIVVWWRTSLVPALRGAFEAIGRLIITTIYRLRRTNLRLPAMTRTAAGGGLIAEPDDDAASIIGRIDTADDVQLVLMVPRNARGLRDPAAWNHIAAHVRRRGIALGVVAARRDVRHHAQENGLPVAGSSGGLRRLRPRTMRVGSREFVVPRLNVLALIRWLILPVAVSAALIATCYVLPEAQIVIVPPSEPFTTSSEVRVDPLADEASAADGVVPGETVRLTFSTVLATGTTGSTEIGDLPATVSLVVRNDGDAAATIDAGSFAINDSGIAFTVDEEGEIPAGESVTVAATANRPGTIGNLDVGELWTVSGAPDSLDISNPSAASGGTNQTVAAVAIEDVDRLRALANEVLVRVGAKQLVAAIESGTVLDETAIVTIIGEDPLLNLGVPADIFLMEFSAVVSALSVSHEQAEAFGAQVLRAALPDAMALLPDTTTVELSDDRSYFAGEVTLSLSATGLAFELFDPELFQFGITGVRPAAAARTLQQRLSLVEEPRVTITPDWLPWIWLPRRGSQIAVNFDGPTAVDEDRPQ
ncbi:MAG TPA: baseplate J/gp47 family protein [Dehalococcoidia bacterium]|nr:baseplate J/gp47 family protein [Dehalococcoidia bacterium]